MIGCTRGKKTTTIPNNMVLHAGEARDLQSATVFPESCHSVALGRVLLLLKLACVILQKGHCSNLIFGAEHIGFLDSKKWSSPVQVDVCAILPAFRGFIVSGELLKQLGAFRVSSRENSKTNTKRAGATPNQRTTQIHRIASDTTALQKH